MRIRRILTSDIPAFHNLWTQTYSEGIYIPNAPPTQERILDVVRKVVAEKMPNFVAVSGEALLGVVEVFPGTMCGISGEDADLSGYLGIQIAAPHRRQGLGRDLMRIAIEDSARYGFKRMELDVLETNHAAIRLYESFEFQDGGSAKVKVMPNGASVMSRSMTLSLSGHGG
ncbi:MAG: GNAT family N-acetyltransferase [Gammaproteobacteria bacterium]|nr:GNAT family N-acetyltransferase [Gammaproteobacteria bacterium]